MEAYISTTTRGLQWCLAIIVRRSRDIPNIIVQGLWSFNLMIYWKGLSHDSTILYLTWHLNSRHCMMSIAQLFLRFAKGLGESASNCLNLSDLYYSQKYIELHRVTRYHHHLSLLKIILPLMMQILILIYSKAESKEIKKHQLKWTNDLNASQMLRWRVFEDSAPSWHGRWWSLFHNPWRIWLWFQTHNYIRSFLNWHFFYCFSQLFS